MMQTPLKFWDIFESAARTVLNKGDYAANEMQRVVAAASTGGKIALYPCNRYSRKILHHLEKNHPDIFRNVVGVFEKSDNFNFRDDVPLFGLDQIRSIRIDTLIVASSKFPKT